MCSRLDHEGFFRIRKDFLGWHGSFSLIYDCIARFFGGPCIGKALVGLLCTGQSIDNHRFIKGHGSVSVCIAHGHYTWAARYRINKPNSLCLAEIQSVGRCGVCAPLPTCSANMDEAERIAKVV